jgi:cyclic beta-1,2-glucan synthetase
MSQSTPAPLLGDERHSVRIEDSGSGCSAAGDIAITRYSGDPIEDAEGFFIYLRDCASGAVWSAGLQPVRKHADRYEVGRDAENVCIARSDHDIDSTLTVRVPPGAGHETRRLALVNRSPARRRIEVTSYVELALHHRRADLSHPAFSKLFVQTEALPAGGALLARRRQRAATERWPWAFHALLGGAEEFETDRARFIGRGRTLATPVAIGAPLSGTTGSVLDPCLALRRTVELEPGASAELSFLLGTAADRNAALAILADLDHIPQPPGPFRHPLENAPPPGQPHAEAERREELRFDNGYGSFTPTGDEYVIRLGGTSGDARLPPLPWSNVIANESFGFLVSERGSAHTWSRNSRLNRLTPWANDPVTDPYGEALYLRDADTGIAWSPLPGPLPDDAPCEVRHGFGYSAWRKSWSGIEHDVCMFVPRHEPLKIARLTLVNTGAAARRLTLTAYFRLVMGEAIEDSAPHIATTRDEVTGALFAVNPGNADFADGVAFAAIVTPGGGACSWTTDRAEFIGDHRDPTCPLAIATGEPLSGRTGTGLDPCLALQAVVELPAGATVECAVLFGEAIDLDQARRLVARHGDTSAIEPALDRVRSFWQHTLSAVRIRTPEPAIDLMVNGWLLYQTIACRLWARTAYYQSGGAFGFRDQLQDSAALLHVRPDLMREQILLHACHQFIEGDVLHWWHPPKSRGTRTRFADDLLWLPYLTAHYVEATGDRAVLDERRPWLAARPLAEGEDEAYLLPKASGRDGSVYEHCCAAIDRSLAVGAHGLPLMGTGDWNDAMNRIGRGGRGESVWVGFFLYAILGAFAPLCAQRGDTPRATRYRGHRDRLRITLNEAGWDGGWYRRAYYDDGTPIGTAGGDECRIDALAQAWSVISGAAPPDRAALAMDAVEARLIDEANRLIRLLDPPFDTTPHDPGYIKGYVPGTRENGGQYTHAALWVVRALAELGRGDRTARLLAMLSPVHHARDAAAAGIYKLEPYAVAADVYGVPPHVGRGGWSWYTGSAGWMYRVALESLLGLNLRNGDTLEIRPCLPASWKDCRIDYRVPGSATTYGIDIANPRGGCVVITATVDGGEIEIEGGVALIPLIDDGCAHHVRIELQAPFRG